jgi:triosephosphate isomerase
LTLDAGTTNVKAILVDRQANVLARSSVPLTIDSPGRTATAAQAQEAHAFIRSVVASVFDLTSAEGVRIQYGGSVKPENAQELMRQKDADGALVGGASLDPYSFAQIVRSA